MMKMNEFGDNVTNMRLAKSGDVAECAVNITPADCHAAADEIERLRVELRHCINELRSDTSRPPHRIRRAALAEKALPKTEPAK